MANTNLTPDMERALALIRGGDGIALFSAFLDGEPVGVIVSIEEQPTDFTITPLAVLVTEGMVDRLTDHDGVKPYELHGDQPQEGATR